MFSVTGVANNYKQPRGGYLSIKQFNKIVVDDGNTLYESENIHATLVGLVVDYLTRLNLGNKAEDVFSVSLRGASKLDNYNGDCISSSNAKSLLSNIKGIDTESIISACKLVGYDTVARSGVNGYKPVSEIEPDENTIKNIEIMVKRSLSFFNKYGPVVSSGFNFEGGYTRIVSSGDGDYLTKDCLWDFKVTKNEPTTKHTFQLLLYYIMGCHSIHKEFNNISKIGIFNPRKNKVYTLDIQNINKDIIDEVSTCIIGYED